MFESVDRRTDDKRTQEWRGTISQRLMHNQSARIHRLVCAFVVRTPRKQGFSRRDLMRATANNESTTTESLPYNCLNIKNKIQGLKPGTEVSLYFKILSGVQCTIPGSLYPIIQRIHYVAYTIS